MYLYNKNATAEFGPSAGGPCPACALTRNLKVGSYSHRGGPAVAVDSICLHAAKKSEHIVCVFYTFVQEFFIRVL